MAFADALKKAKKAPDKQVETGQIYVLYLSFAYIMVPSNTKAIAFHKITGNRFKTTPYDSQEAAPSIINELKSKLISRALLSR